MAAVLYIYRRQICTWWWRKNGVTGRLVVTSPSSRHEAEGLLRAVWTGTASFGTKTYTLPRWTDTQSPERRRWGREDVPGPHFSRTFSKSGFWCYLRVLRKEGNGTNAPYPMHIPSFLPSFLIASPTPTPVYFRGHVPSRSGPRPATKAYAPAALRPSWAVEHILSLGQISTKREII